MYSRKEVVLLVVKHIIAKSHTWSNKLCNATFNKLFGEFGVLKLVAYSHTFTSTNKLWQIGVESMMWESCHLIAFVVTIVTMSKRDT